jgi:putative ABC transport system permease protein
MIRIASDPGKPSAKSNLPMQIVGIAPPIKEELLDVAPPTHAYVPFGRHYGAGMFVLVRRGSPVETSAATAAGELRAAIRAADPRMPILSASTLQTFHDRGIELWALRTGARLFAGLGLMAMLLAVVGVYGVKSYVVAQRTREVGIRMALGATAGDVLRLILRDGAFLTAGGVALGLPLALLVSVLFSKVFIGIGGFDAWVVAIATMLLTLSAFVASAVPARRATRIQPLRALQGE